MIVATAPLHIYAILFAISAVSTFFMPAQSVALPLIIGREDLIANKRASARPLDLIDADKLERFPQ